MINQNSPWFPYRSHPKNRLVSVSRYLTNPPSLERMRAYQAPGIAWPKRFGTFEAARQFADALNAQEAREKAEAA